MNIKNLVPVEWSNQRVLLSKQIAECYKCAEDRIKDNFNANKEQYTEGLHYFKITGSDLQNLRVGNPDLQISPMTRTLYLWTYQGCVRHCKSINTPEAWNMFDELEQNYFNQNSVVVVKSTPAINPNRRAGQLADARVYVLLMSDGTIQIVKLGQSKNIRSRVAKIKRDTGLTVKDIYFSPFMSRENARLVEWACQEKFSSRRVEGEFFSVEFEEACKAIDSFVKMVAAPAIDSDLKRGGKIFKVVKRNIIEHANMLADKNPD